MSSHNRHLCDDCLQEEYDSFRHTCVHESMAKNDVWLEKFHIHDWPRWDYSMDEATLTFSESGVSKVVCEMQVVGSSQGTRWEWSWGNPNFPMACRHRMSEVRDLGLEKQWGNLSKLFLDYDEYVGWECASVANHVLGGIGAYRCPYENGAVYLVILSCQFVN